MFEAFTFDQKDGSLTGTSVLWSSSLDGALGTGHYLEVSASALTLGEHLITVVATDSDGAQATATTPLWIDVDVEILFSDGFETGDTSAWSP
jgi:hypothetical protein